MRLQMVQRIGDFSIQKKKLPVSIQTSLSSFFQILTQT